MWYAVEWWYGRGVTWQCGDGTHVDARDVDVGISRRSLLFQRRSKLDRQRLLADEIAVSGEGIDPFRTGPYREPDAVRDVQICCAARLLHEPDQISCPALELQLVGDIDVERDHSDVAGQPGARSVVTGDELE